MSKQIGPPGTDRIQITGAVLVVKPDTLAAFQRDERKRFMMLHLGTWMPDGSQASLNPAGGSGMQMFHLKFVCHVGLKKSTVEIVPLFILFYETADFMQFLHASVLLIAGNEFDDSPVFMFLVPDDFQTQPFDR